MDQGKCMHNRNQPQKRTYIKTDSMTEIGVVVLLTSVTGDWEKKKIKLKLGCDCTKKFQLVDFTYKIKQLIIGY